MKRFAKLGKKAAGALYKAKTAPLQVASKVTKTIAPKTKLAKGLDKIANPRIFKAQGGAANSGNAGTKKRGGKMTKQSNMGLFGRD